MPINLAAKLSSAPADPYSPKYFDKRLTGSDRRSGLFSCPSLVSNSFIPAEGDESRYSADSKMIRKADDVTTNVIPAELVPWKMLSGFESLVFDPDSVEKILLAETGPCNYYLTTGLKHLEVIETGYPNDPAKTVQSLGREYQITMIRQIRGLNDNTFTLCPCTSGNFYLLPENTIQIVYTDNPQSVLDYFTERIRHYEPKADIYKEDAEKFIAGRTDYRLACIASEKWQCKSVQVFQFIFDCWRHQCSSYGVITSYDREQLTQMFSKLASRLEYYTLSLDQYSDLFSFLCAHNSDMDMREVVSRNLFLLLHSTIEDLSSAKSSLTVPPLIPSGMSPKDFYVSAGFSKQQQAIIESSEPLILCQSGAGTGKSTVVKERISYLCRLGVLPADIMVLSFTNAAASHIRKLNGSVMSKAIASIIHDLYQFNFASHNLSTVSSVINAVEISFPDDDEARMFIQLLKGVMNNGSGALSRLNVFVEKLYDKVRYMLNTIRMTCLELEQIICCLKLYELKEPIDLAAKFIIVDEVQDTSVYEFIFLLKYTCKNAASMMMIGDCSQTLFEFRASNPRIMNTLEASSTFALYQLTTNYRSNPEILSMANVMLQHISANQFANIQLVSNSLSRITKDSFKEKVHTWYAQCNARTYREKFRNDFPIATAGYIQEKLARNEKIAIAAPRRIELSWVEEGLKQIVPNAKVANLCPQRMYSNTVLSDFIKKSWDTVNRQLGIPLIRTIAEQIKAPHLGSGSKSSQAAITYTDIWAGRRSAYFQSLEAACDSGQISLDQCLELMKQDMMAYESDSNMAKQARISRINEALKNKDTIDNADIVLSTIHSIKGLEFDHVILIADNGRFSDEADKRMYYVGLTRAMKSELIYVHGSENVSVVDAIHQQIVNSL